MRLTYKQIRYMDAVPRFYRIAYYDPALRVGYCYPIGLHLIVWAARRLWELTYWWSPSRLEMLIEEKVNAALDAEREERRKETDRFINTPNFKAMQKAFNEEVTA